MASYISWAGSLASVGEVERFLLSATPMMMGVGIVDGGSSARVNVSNSRFRYHGSRGTGSEVLILRNLCAGVGRRWLCLSRES